MLKIFIRIIFQNLQKKYLEHFVNFFFDENHHMDNTNALHYSKICPTQYYTMKTDPFQKIRLSWKCNCTYIFIKVPKNTILWVQHYVCNPTIWNPTAPAFQNTLTFSQYLLNLRSNMQAILPTVSEQTPQTRTYNLYHWKAWSVAVIWA